MAGPYDHFRTHRQSRRLAGHDYAAAGWTFVTICTGGRRSLLGEVRGGLVGLIAAGCIAYDRWIAIPEHEARARLDALVVMPNHVHGLIGLVPDGRPGTTTRAPPRLRPADGSLSAILGRYKAAVTRRVRPIDPSFAWQPRFHDRVVRSEKEVEAIRAYIENNPAAWGADLLHPQPASPSPPASSFP